VCQSGAVVTCFSGHIELASQFFLDVFLEFEEFFMVILAKFKLDPRIVQHRSLILHHLHPQHQSIYSTLLILRLLLQHGHETPELTHFLPQLRRVIDHSLTNFFNTGTHRIILGPNGIFEVTQIIKRLFRVLDHLSQESIMIIHFEFEVIKRLHYHGVIGFQPLLNHFSVGFNLLNFGMDLFKHI
jgi:hypothetical protein